MMTDYKNMKLRDDSAKKLIDSIIDGLLTGLSAIVFIAGLFAAHAVVWG